MNPTTDPFDQVRRAIGALYMTPIVQANHERLARFIIDAAKAEIRAELAEHAPHGWSEVFLDSKARAQADPLPPRDGTEPTGAPEVKAPEPCPTGFTYTFTGLPPGRYQFIEAPSPGEPVFIDSRTTYRFNKFKPTGHPPIASETDVAPQGEPKAAPVPPSPPRDERAHFNHARHPAPFAACSHCGEAMMFAVALSLGMCMRCKWFAMLPKPGDEPRELRLTNPVKFEEVRP